MSWRAAVARIAATPRSRVGPTTTASLLSGPEGRTWRGVRTSPVNLHKDARLDRNTYAIARCIVSEVGTASPLAALALAETLRNAADRKGIDAYAYLTALTSSGYVWTRHLYGEQHGRRASTRQDPDARAVEAARSVLSERINVTRGAVSWFDPRLQDAGRQGDRTLANDAKGIAIKWAKEDGLEWIGPLPDVDSYRHVAFLRPVANANPDALIRLIEHGRAGRPTIGTGSPDDATRAVAEQGAPWLELLALSVIIL